VHKLGLVLIAALAFTGAANATGVKAKAPRKHALPRAAKAVAAAVSSPKRPLKVVLGSILFAVETGNDVVLGGLEGLDKAASMELKYNPFHYIYYVDDKIDVGLEAGETFFFGSHN